MSCGSSLTPVLVHAQTPQHEICHMGYRIVAKNLTHAAAGNISLKTEDNLWITPSGFALEELTEDSLVLMNSDGSFQAKSPHYKPSSEWKIHQRVYEARPDVMAVVHAHPPKATALAIAGRDLMAPLLAEAIGALGPVPLVPFCIPGSDDLAEAVYQGIKHHHGLILKNHGVLTVGKDLREACHRLELLEALAEMVILAHQLGPLSPLSPQQVLDVQSSTCA